MKTEGKALLINGYSYEVVDFPSVDMDAKLDWYYKMIDCDCIDIVRPYGIEDMALDAGLESFVGKFVLICDDESLLKADPKVNPIASLLYGVDVHKQPLFGKVLVGKNLETDDGLDTVGLTDNDVAAVLAFINALIENHNEKVATK